jgi:hypothetical protein
MGFLDGRGCEPTGLAAPSEPESQLAVCPVVGTPLRTFTAYS